ncbi:MAG: ribosome-associated translation inhibitor RaiA [Actinomycetota bacterium]|nr:ribosome-associated translation inhibitor RaiA [Actinomycetota bacterium]
MEIVVKGRNSEISDRFREHVHEKLLRIEKFDQRQKIHRVEVEVTHEKNPRQHDRAARVEMTLRSRGPAVRAEASSTDQHSALDAVMDKLESRLRKSVDRMRIHHGNRTPQSVAAATAASSEADVQDTRADTPDEGQTFRKEGPIQVEGDGPLVCREKSHDAQPMTLDQALYEMEMVGHDFYLFVEKDSMKPSVVYLRKGYDYGVIHLNVSEG